MHRSAAWGSWERAGGGLGLRWPGDGVRLEREIGFFRFPEEYYLDRMVYIHGCDVGASRPLFPDSAIAVSFIFCRMRRLRMTARIAWRQVSLCAKRKDCS